MSERYFRKRPLEQRGGLAVKIFTACLVPTVFVGCGTSGVVTPDAVSLSAKAVSEYVSCEFPTDVPAASAAKTAFDKYSWRMFTALNQPVGVNRGEPDCSQPIGSTSDTVWRSFKPVDQIFLPNALNPGPWNSPFNTETLINEISKVTSEVESTVDQPVGGWLIDQRGNPTYYQIAANEISYDYIVDNGLYNKDTAESFALIDFPDFATEVKAGWRILEPVEDTSRYLTTPATVATFDSQGNKNGTANVTLGLVGLHIITKAKGFPQWIWATFEQVDNISTAPGVFSSYYNPSAPADKVNQSPCVNHATPCVPKPGASFQTPNPLTRVTPIAASTSSVNTAAQAELDNTFLQYYQLITTQWPSDPNDPGNPAGSPTPGVAANVTMESYIQPTSSCMDCHSTAVVKPGKKSDYSFLFLHAQAPANNCSLCHSAAEIEKADSLDAKFLEKHLKDAAAGLLEK